MRVLPRQTRLIPELMKGGSHRDNPAWIMRNEPYRVRKLDYGMLRRFLHYQASHELRLLTRVPDELHYASTTNAYIGNNEYTDLVLDFNRPEGVLQPFYWMNGTHLVLPDIVNRMERDGADAYEYIGDEPVEEVWSYHWEGGWEFEEFGYYEGHQIPGATWTWWDLHGEFYVVPDGKIAGIHFRTPQMLNIDHHPTVQMSLYGLLLALRQEDVIIPETVMVTTIAGWRGPEEIWDFIYELGSDAWAEEIGNDAYYEELPEHHIAKVWNDMVRSAGASEAALWPRARTLEEVPDDDRALILNYMNEDLEWFPLGVPRAGEMLEILAAGPYTCNVHYTPAPWVPGYAPGFIPGAAPPLDLQPPPEVYGQYGGPELPPPEAHPSATHSPKLRLGDPLEERRKRG